MTTQTEPRTYDEAATARRIASMPPADPGALAEQKHQYRDLDPDSTCCLPDSTCPDCPPAEYVAQVDGTTLDLRLDHADVLGTVWRWTRQRDADGQPLMHTPGRPGSPLPLPDVYGWYGPLIPIGGRPTAAQYRALLTGGER